MLSRRAALSAGRLSFAQRQFPTSAVVSQMRFASQAAVEDPDMNGGYQNPPPNKRQFRDPYGEWWDKQDRRNFGEPLHEDNDVMTIMSPEEYTHYKPAKAFFLFGCAVTGFLASVGLMRAFWVPPTPFVRREFPGGLEKELGGPNAISAHREPQDTL